MTQPETRPRTRKYLERQESIIQAATVILNQNGLKGMTIADVSEHFGLVPTGITYYFSSKEELAAECFLRSIAALERMIADALTKDTVPDRLTRLVQNVFKHRRQVDAGEEPEYAQFDDIRTLSDQRVLDAFTAMFRHLRKLFRDKDSDRIEKTVLNTRTHFLLQQIIWLELWLGKFELEDYERVCDQFLEILLRGIGTPGHAWNPDPLIVPPPASRGQDSTHETFLRAATQLINEQGYLGASVDRISSRLDVTKGSFYHYIDAKDDLVAVCYNRTIETIRGAQSAALKLPEDAYTRLASALMSLADDQLYGDALLLRLATVSLPPEIREKIHFEYERSGIRFGSMVNDGLIDGSLRLIDVQIAAQIVSAMVNALCELPLWLPEPPDGSAAAGFVRPLFDGLLIADGPGANPVAAATQ